MHKKKSMETNYWTLLKMKIRKKVKYWNKNEKTKSETIGNSFNCDIYVMKFCGIYHIIHIADLYI